MAEPAITIESVSKQYSLGEGVRYDRSMVQQLDSVARRMLRRQKRDVTDPQEREFWALRDVSMEIQEGEVVGLIGANGAGKSTLLKLLARITSPTEGSITLRGKTGSLLEVGTGFHPELTGRENIFLNGSILGMRRQEIMNRYEEIVEFSGISKFIETPVKRYSSGMFIRLAFSVAVHLEPEILLIDEVLAVGDAEFQRKCLNKMESIAHSDGHTVVFVSHSLSSVRSLCDRVALIEDGRLVVEGRSDEIVADYMHRVEPVQHGGVSSIPADAERAGTGEAMITKISLLNEADQPIDRVGFGESFTVALRVEAKRPIPSAAFIIGISNPEGARVLTTSSVDDGSAGVHIEPGRSVEVRAQLKATLLPTEFAIDAAVVEPSGTTIDHVERALSFNARNVAPDGSPDHYPWDTLVGFVRPDTRWAIDQGASAEARSERVGL